MFSHYGTIDLATETAPAELLENELTSKALSIVERSAMSEAQLNAYERFWINLTDEEGIALARYNRGRADGRAEGMAEGANKANRENARKMKADGLSLELIAKYTSLSIEEIEAL
jgi:predicted transposase/invertase (TIGR01784 family)